MNECNCEHIALTGELDLGYRGDDGLTPFIGDNGNWWIGERDTGVKAKGEDGRPLTWDDLTPEQKAELKGDPFRYEDFTPEQLEGLRGEPGTPGEPGYTPQKGIDYFDGDPGAPGKDGMSGGLLFPNIDYDPVAGTIVIKGLEQEVSRITFDDETNELVITF